MIYYELTLTSVDSRVKTIKALKNGLHISLEDASKLYERFREEDELDIYDGSDFNKVQRTMQELDEAGATYEMHNYYD